MDVRCESSTKHFELVEPGVIEVKCHSKWCGARSGVVVLHRFDAFTGELIVTTKFAEPPRKESKAHGASNYPAAVRTS